MYIYLYVGMYDVLTSYLYMTYARYAHVRTCMYEYGHVYTCMCNMMYVHDEIISNIDERTYT